MEEGARRGHSDTGGRFVTRKRISQRQARELKKRVDELERREMDRRNAWAREWVDGVHLSSVSLDRADYAVVKTARRLGHAIVATTPNDGKLELYALPVAK